MNRKEKFAELSRVLTEGLAKLEDENASMADAGAQLIKAGIAVCLAASGPSETLTGMLGLFEQLSAAFPAEGAAAETGRTFPPVKGFA